MWDCNGTARRYTTSAARKEIGERPEPAREHAIYDGADQPAGKWSSGPCPDPSAQEHDDVMAALT